MNKQRLIDAEELKNQFKDYIAIGDKRFVEGMLHYRSIALGLIDNAPTIEAREKWTMAEDDLPKNKGEYLVAYHPCYWDRVQDEIKVGTDSFRGKTGWAKHKYQRVIAWIPKPKPPKEGKK